MRILGYSDRISVAPEETIRFMVSTEVNRYSVDIVRLIQGDDSAAGPGFREQLVDAACAGEYAGRHQLTQTGSFIHVPDNAALSAQAGITLQTWFLSTTPTRRLQGLMGRWSPDGRSGYGLFIGDDGHVRFRIGNDAGGVSEVRAEGGLLAGRWYFLAGSYDAASGEVTFEQELLAPPWKIDERFIEKRAAILPPALLGSASGPFLIAAYSDSSRSGSSVTGHFNGRIESPKIFDRALSSNELDDLRHGTVRDSAKGALIAAWDFSRESPSARIADSSPNELHGRAINAPLRAVRSHGWEGSEADYRRVPDQYAAIHFHDDDLEDAGWEVDFELTVPEHYRSGVYAARLRGGESEDYVPFFVRPRKGKPTARVVFLAPTLTYMAYANERFYAGDLQDWSLTSDRELTLSPQDQYLASHPELGISTYDVHSDGSAVACHSSRLRPIVNMRPKLTSYWTGAGRHFCADLYLTYWLEEKGFEYDVITDEDLHADGLDLVSDYRTVITGSHPEYWTWEMRKAIDAYLQQGGRLMYLGGNGAWWVTAIDGERPHLMEVRKDDYTQSTPQLGVNGAELHLSSTGERGGTWRSRGLDPAEIFGVSLTGEGWDHAGAYRRTPGSQDERVAFVFDGIAEDEAIGEVGLALGGAAGDEYDRVDFLYGSPPHTLILASSFGHSERDKRFGDAYQPVEVREARVRSDIAYFELQDGGAVFAAGSVSWTAALPHNGCDNPVSKITENVLRRFSE